MRRSGWFLALVLFFIPGLRAADGPGLPFPLAPLIQAARSRDFPWRPDWPLSLPPDSFAARPPSPADGLPRSITVTTADGVYTLRRDSAGFVREFPWIFGETLINVAFSPDAAGFRAGAGPATDAVLTGEFLDFSPEDPGLPVLCRVSSGDAWFFVRLEYRGRFVLETWFDAAGAALGHFEHTWSGILADGGDGEGRPQLLLTLWTDFGAPPELSQTDGDAEGPPAIPARTEYFRDSFGNLCGITAGDAEGAVLRETGARFMEGQLRYWTRPVVTPSGDPELTGTFAFQWDGRALPVRFSGSAGEDGAWTWDSRCDYRIGADGNWEGRTETLLIRRQGFFVQGGTLQVSRRIVWREGE